jgi:hypothetical protein
MKNVHPGVLGIFRTIINLLRPIWYIAPGGVPLEKCAILCRLRFKKDDGLDYDHQKTICIGTFPDHESAGEFMTEYMDNDKQLKETLNLLFKDEVVSVENWEVADIMDKEHIASNWTDHETAQRSTQERGRFNYS